VSRSRSGITARAVALCVTGMPGGKGEARPAPAGFQVRRMSVRGERLAFAVYLPPDYDRQRTWPCIVYLHGSGEYGTDGEKPTRIGLGPALLAHPERWPFIVVMPQKPREDEEWMEHEELVIGARHADQWSCLVPVCGYGRANTTASRIWQLPIWAFQGLADDSVDPRETQGIVAAVRDRQKAAGIGDGDPRRARLTLYPDLGHECWDAAYGDPALAAWMLERRRGR
jgi:predicted peptidase